jgi:hypothetical protein
LRKQYRLFWPVNDLCLTCNVLIVKTTERHYIIWNPRETRHVSANGRVTYTGDYRRQCARCYDAETGYIKGRRSASDGHITGNDSVKQ